jgi:hypothetical protein
VGAAIRDFHTQLEPLPTINLHAYAVSMEKLQVLFPELQLRRLRLLARGPIRIPASEMREAAYR